MSEEQRTTCREPRGRTTNNEPPVESLEVERRTMTDFESLKAAAKDRIAKNDYVGLNPHKVLRLCIEFEQLKRPVLSETPVIDGEQAAAPCREPLFEPEPQSRRQGRTAVQEQTLAAGTMRRVIRTLSWMIEDMKHRFDDCRGNLDNGSEGGYSPELTEAIELLDELEKGTGPARHHAGNTLAAAYKQGFEDAKKVILKDIREIVK